MKTMMDVAALKGGMDPKAQAARDRAAAVGIEPGNFPMVSGRDYHARPGARPTIYENRRPTRRQTPRKLKMRVKRLTRTTE